jgi:hypothetical protein
VKVGVAAIEALLPEGLEPRVVPGLGDLLQGRVPGPSLKGWLVRRKDAKLLPRAARLALPVAGAVFQAYSGDPEDLGLHVGVRREPPDSGQADMAIAASIRDGRLDTRLLAGRGRDLYPPLLPLETLPNMVLAHVSINLGIRGPGDASTGGPAAGIQALRLAMHDVVEGRAPASLVVVADSLVDGASHRDQRRLGFDGPLGEGAVALLLVPSGQGLFELSDEGAGAGADPAPWGHWDQIGRIGCVDPLVQLLQGPGRVRGVDDTGAWAAVQRW